MKQKQEGPDILSTQLLTINDLKQVIRDVISSIDAVLSIRVAISSTCNKKNKTLEYILSCVFCFTYQQYDSMFIIF